MRLLCIYALSLLALTANASEPLSLRPDASDSVMITRDFMEYTVTGPSVTWTDVLAIEQPWSSPQADTVGDRVVGQAQWLRIPVRNESAEDARYMLEVRWPLFQSIEMRVLRGDSFNVPEVNAGMVSENPRVFSNKNIVFPVELAPREEAAIYLRVVDKAFLYMPMFISSEETFAGTAEYRLFLISLAVGVMAIMVLYNASLYLFTRDRMYLVYSNSGISTTLMVLTISGLGQHLIWSDNVWLRTNAYPVFTSYAFLSVTYFFRVFVHLKAHGGWVYKLNTFTLALWAFIVGANFVGWQVLSLSLTALAGLVMTPLAFVSTLWLWHKSHSARYFAIAWFPVCVATLYSILAVFAIAPYFPGLDYFLTYGLVFEIVVLSVALAERINSERRAREEAQALALQQQRSFLELQERAKNELEETVEQRTRELKSALAALSDANAELATLSETDALTKLGNRRHFDNAVEMEVLRAIRSEKPLTVMLIDIDFFKAVNDNYGHLVGDQCLKLIADTIGKVVERETDVVVRYGGEEFAIVLPNTSTTAAHRIAERLRKQVETTPLMHKGKPIPLTISIGYVSSRLSPGADAKTLLEAADKALYEAKQSGRNRAVGAGPQPFIDASSAAPA